MKGVLPIIKRKSGCDYHRIINPMTYLGMDVDNVIKITTPDILKETKVLFFNRTPENPIEKVLKLKFKYGFKIVLDLDDYWELNVTHPLYKTWIEKKMGEEIIKWIPNADAVTVTTARLADKVRPFNKNVHVIPNALPFGDGQFNDERYESTFTRFIYTGGESHIRDIDILKLPFSRLTGVEDAKFILAGYNPNNPKVWDKMDRVFRITKKSELREYQPLDCYMDLYKEADISIVPLESNIFTPYKSNLKVLEAGCKNIPVICSNVPPYSDEPNKDVIMYASNTREWVHWITYCYKNKQFVNEKGLELGEYVRKNYDLRKINEYRKQLFENLMS
jgi:glycosyltransferase involved in cell wall biosynthesis